MPITPSGSLNLAAINVPNVYVQIIPPNPVINGVPTNIIGIVGSATWGPVNSPTRRGSMQEYVQLFGAPQAQTYDMGTQVYNAALQNASSFVCVRVTDGTDIRASANILDGSTAIGAILNSKYTGTLGNTTIAILSIGSSYTASVPTYKLTIYINNGVPEVFDNISGTGVTFWSNLVNAVNQGQNGIRGPSQICVASLTTTLTSVSITAPGSYATLPTFGTTGPGSGATFIGTMKAVSSTPAAAGSGYAKNDTITATGGTHTINTILTVDTTKLVSVAVNAGGANYIVGDTITLTGGTFSTAAILTVASVSGGAVTGVTITNAGSYTVNSTTFTQGATSGVGSGATFNTALFGVNTSHPTTLGAYTTLPSNPVAQGSTSGTGTGATHTILWGVLSVAVTASGSGYDNTSAFSVTGGGGTGGALGTLNIGSASTPAFATYSLSGGLNGNVNIVDATLIGNDSATPRTGMYALRDSGSTIAVLADQTDSTQWTNQIAFGEDEGIYMIANGAAGQQNSISSAITTKQNAGVASYALKLMLGDYCYINDPFNSVQRLVSPSAFIAGILATQLPSNSSLNKPMNGIVATQKSASNQYYSQDDLLQLETGGIDVITLPIPASFSFGDRIGINTSGSIVTNSDSYTRTINFLALTFNSALGDFIGQPLNPTVVSQARSTMQAYLLNLYNQGLIGDVNHPNDPKFAFSVVMDTSMSTQGILIANVTVVFYAIIQVFVVNLQGGQSVTVSVLPPQSVNQRS